MTDLGHRASELVGELVNAVSATDYVCRCLDRKSIIREDLSGLADNRGHVWHFGSDERVKLSEPYHIGDLPPAIEADIGREFHIGRPFVCELPDVELVGPRGITLAEDGRYVLENSLGYRGALAQNLLQALASGTLPIRRRVSSDPDVDAAVSLVGPWTDGYFHWLSDWLTRLDGAERYAHERGLELELIVPADAKPWMRESLRRCGFPEDRWRWWEGGRMTINRLVIPVARHDNGGSGSAQDYAHSPAAYRWLRDRVLATVNAGDGDNPESSFVYVTRRDAHERRVVNEEEVMEVLNNRGFEAYALSELDFRNQVRLFQRAKTVVAPHGAGLTNVIFGDDLSVVELFGGYANPCYFYTAQALNAPYGCLACDPVGNDLRVDVDALERLLSLLPEARDHSH